MAPSNLFYGRITPTPHPSDQQTPADYSYLYIITSENKALVDLLACLGARALGLTARGAELHPAASLADIK